MKSSKDIQSWTYSHEHLCLLQTFQLFFKLLWICLLNRFLVVMDSLDLAEERDQYQLRYLQIQTKYLKLKWQQFFELLQSKENNSVLLKVWKLFIFNSFYQLTYFNSIFRWLKLSLWNKKKLKLSTSTYLT